MVNNLITLEEYKQAESISNTKDDTKLQWLIESVSQLVKTYCGVSFVDFYSPGTPKTETFNIDWDTNLIQLTESPVLELLSVEERKTFTSDYEQLTSSDYYLDSFTDTITRVSAIGGYKAFSKGPASVRVVYRAGYDVCPPDLRLAVMDLVTYYHKDEHKQRKVAGGSSMQNPMGAARGTTDLPPHIKRVLDFYRTY